MIILVQANSLASLATTLFGNKIERECTCSVVNFPPVFNEFNQEVGVETVMDVYRENLTTLYHRLTALHVSRSWTIFLFIFFY